MSCAWPGRVVTRFCAALEYRGCILQASYTEKEERKGSSSFKPQHAQTSVCTEILDGDGYMLPKKKGKSNQKQGSRELKGHKWKVYRVAAMAVPSGNPFFQNWCNFE